MFIFNTTNILTIFQSFHLIFRFFLWNCMLNLCFMYRPIHQIHFIFRLAISGCLFAIQEVSLNLFYNVTLVFLKKITSQQEGNSCHLSIVHRGNIHPKPVVLNFFLKRTVFFQRKKKKPPFSQKAIFPHSYWRSFTFSSCYCSGFPKAFLIERNKAWKGSILNLKAVDGKKYTGFLSLSVRWRATL